MGCDGRVIRRPGVGSGTRRAGVARSGPFAIPLPPASEAPMIRKMSDGMRVDLGGKPCGPLAGIRVIDLSTIVSGPLCGQVFGDLGADVIKVETRAGDSARYMGGERRASMTGFFAQVNRNKRSVALDLKKEGGAAAFRRLAKEADVLLENFRPGVMERLGLGYERLREDNAKLIYAAISGFGPGGPYDKQPAYDMVVQALSGFAKVIGSDENPRLISNLVADKTSGLTAAYAVLAALFERERTGMGQRVDIPMLDAFASFLHLDVIGAGAFGAPPQDSRLGDLLFRAWETADGHVVSLAIEDHQFEGLCRVLGREDAIGDERFATLMARFQNAGELIEFLEAELCKHSTAELVRRALEHEIPLAPVHGLMEFLADPQVQDSKIVFELEHPEAGPIPMMRSAPRFSRTPSDVRRGPPMLGEHTAEVLREVGLSDEEIGALQESD